MSTWGHQKQVVFHGYAVTFSVHKGSRRKHLLNYSNSYGATSSHTCISLKRDISNFLAAKKHYFHLIMSNYVCWLFGPEQEVDSGF